MARGIDPTRIKGYIYIYTEAQGVLPPLVNTCPYFCRSNTIYNCFCRFARVEPIELDLGHPGLEEVQKCADEVVLHIYNVSPPLFVLISQKSCVVVGASAIPHLFVLFAAIRPKNTVSKSIF